MRFLSMAALALVGAIMAGCSSSDDGIGDNPPQPENTGKVVTLKTTVGFDDKAGTRALTADGVKTFAMGETMALRYNNGTSEVKAESHALEAGDIAEDGKSATFTFNLTEEPNKSSSVSYIYPAAMANDDGSINYDALLTEQDGTLATLASTFDLATANDLDWDGDNLPSADLENQLAILAITLTDYVTGADITGNITDLNISLGEQVSYNINRSATAGPIYVAIQPTSSTIFEVTATDGTNTYTKTLTDRNYAAGNGYNVSWRMTNTMQSVPLTMKALTAGTIVVNNPQSTMKYSVNDGNATNIPQGKPIDVKAGDMVHFYGSNNFSNGISGYNNIAGGTAQVKVYGNIMSLVNETDFATASTLTMAYTFASLFRGNTNLTDASGLLLPATTLTEGCYAAMFYGCTNLTIAPVLPAETLVTNCYQSMFFGCTKLNSVTCLATNISANGCTVGWLTGVAASGTFTKAASMTGWTPGVNGIPYGWTCVNY